ncbi:MAG: hypothetical protein OXC54_06730 [Rhodospirillaceae bacterium]|nr:hypothetical protein [Rhodospirillaceae bacterium]MCY4310988.1 hypothetical protein [Rhodospirillaceae bacterium]
MPFPEACGVLSSTLRRGPPAFCATSAASVVAGFRLPTLRFGTPQEHDSYEDEKYGEGYTGTVFGE